MLRRYLTLAAAALVVTIGLAGPSQAQPRNDRINLVVVSEDADPDTVPRNNRIFNRVQTQLSEYMNTRGFQVYDETAMALGMTPTGRVRRRDAELIEVARAVSASTPIDAMVIYQIYASVRRSPAANIRYPSVRLTARILNVRTGQLVGSYEKDDFQFPPLPFPCERECLLETIGGHAKMLATDLGSGLSTKIEAFARPAGVSGGVAVAKDAPVGVAPAPQGGASQDGCVNLPTDIEIQLRDFTPADMNRVESQFVSWGCYQQHRTVSMTDSMANFFYRTSADTARITRNFRLMMEVLGINAQVTFAGNRVTVTKLLTR
jgi:hypothetical protein